MRESGHRVNVCRYGGGNRGWVRGSSFAPEKGIVTVRVVASELAVLRNQVPKEGHCAVAVIVALGSVGLFVGPGDDVVPGAIGAAVDPVRGRVEPSFAAAARCYGVEIEVVAFLLAGAGALRGRSTAVVVEIG